MINFCNKCNNLLYIKNKETNELEYYCRNCDNIEEYKEDDYCVYENKINNDFYIHNIINNKWLIKDPTLPVLNNIDCINKNCIINNYIDNSIIIYNCNDDTISKINKKINNINIKKLDDKYIIIFENKDTLNKNFDNVKSVCKSDKNDIVINKKNEKRVTFIQYDNDDMKYLYICNYCNNSWKNN